MPQHIHVNGFEMATPGHINHGLWRVPGNRRTQYTSLDYWTDLARTLERGLFDAVFLADVVGTYTTYKGDRRAALRAGMQVPNIDPTFVIPAMAAVTGAPGLRGHVDDHVRAAVRPRTSAVHPRPSDRGPARVEHRHRLPAGRGTELRAERADQARRPVRHRRGVP